MTPLSIASCQAVHHRNVFTVCAHPFHVMLYTNAIRQQDVLTLAQHVLTTLQLSAQSLRQHKAWHPAKMSPSCLPPHQGICD